MLLNKYKLIYKKGGFQISNKLQISPLSKKLKQESYLYIYKFFEARKDYMELIHKKYKLHILFGK